MRLVLVRHAESEVPCPGLEDEFTRPLSSKGFLQAQNLIPVLAAYHPEVVCSSPYIRAIQTVAPTAEALGLPVETFDNFREHRMSDAPISNWRDVLAVQWSDFNHIPPTGESMTSTQARGWSVLEALLAEYPNRTVVLAGHGTIISLVLHRHDPTIGLDFHLAMPNPAIYELWYKNRAWRRVEEIEVHDCS